MATDRPISKNAGPNSRKNRWLRIQEIHRDIDQLDVYIENRKFGSQGTLALMAFRDLLHRTIYQLEKGGL